NSASHSLSTSHVPVHTPRAQMTCSQSRPSKHASPGAPLSSLAGTGRTHSPPAGAPASTPPSSVATPPSSRPASVVPPSTRSPAPPSLSPPSESLASSSPPSSGTSSG